MYQNQTGLTIIHLKIHNAAINTIANELQLQNITIKLLLFHLIKKNFSKFCVRCNLSKNARIYGHAYCSKQVLVQACAGAGYRGVFS